MKILVTGNAGFIGSHVVQHLLNRGDEVVGIDSVNDYYDVLLKHARLTLQIETAKKTDGSFEFVHGNIADTTLVKDCFTKYNFEKVVHLAAQAGVRYSIENPMAYVESNIVGFTNILEGCRHHKVQHLVYASTSSVYGANKKMPFSEHDTADHPIQFYAATKRSNELMAHSYSHLFNLPTTGLRFFTVYGPWGRPDMAIYSFTDKISKGEPIQLFNGGNHSRDFTYIDDIVQGIVKSMDTIATSNEIWDADVPDVATSYAPYRIFNIGNSNPVNLIDYITAIEVALGKTAIKEYLPLQPGDVPDTFADMTELKRFVGYQPVVGVSEGVSRFVEWFKQYHKR
jgi:UDP-glucuronate 4-epimerase